MTPREKGPAGSFPCPVCGEEVPEGALSCRACGADDETGWKQDAESEAQGLDLPESSIDDEAYDDFVKSELGEEPVETDGPSGPGLLLVVLGVLAVAGLLALILTAGK